MALAYRSDHFESLSSQCFIKGIALQKKQQNISLLPIQLENEWNFYFDKYPGPNLSPQVYLFKIICEEKRKKLTKNDRNMWIPSRSLAV
jgi:hypothetical protein